MFWELIRLRWTSETWHTFNALGALLKSLPSLLEPLEHLQKSKCLGSRGSLCHVQHVPMSTSVPRRPLPGRFHMNQRQLASNEWNLQMWKKFPKLRRFLLSVGMLCPSEITTWSFMVCLRIVWNSWSTALFRSFICLCLIYRNIWPIDYNMIWHEIIFIIIHIILFPDGFV